MMTTTNANTMEKRNNCTVDGGKRDRTVRIEVVVVLDSRSIGQGGETILMDGFVLNQSRFHAVSCGFIRVSVRFYGDDVFRNLFFFLCSEKRKISLMCMCRPCAVIIFIICPSAECGHNVIVDRGCLVDVTDRLQEFFPHITSKIFSRSRRAPLLRRMKKQ